MSASTSCGGFLSALLVRAPHDRTNGTGGLRECGDGADRPLRGRFVGRALLRGGPFAPRTRERGSRHRCRDGSRCCLARSARVLGARRRAGSRVSRSRKTLHESPRIEWVDDSLPRLARVVERGQSYPLVLLSAVWQHIDDGQRRVAMRVLRTLTAYGGCLLISVRHGPGAATRPCFPASADAAIEMAHANGFERLSSIGGFAPSLQPAGGR